jgi:ribose transport system permease protein
MTASAANPAPPEVVAVRSSRLRARTWAIAAKYGTIIVLLAMCVIFSVTMPVIFLSTRNFSNVLAQISLTAIIAGGVTLVLVVGEFDMSIGYNASLAGILVVGLMHNQGLPTWLAIIVVIVAASFVGFVNGILVTKLGVNALIATLGSGTVLVGVNYFYSNAVPIALGPNQSPGFTHIALGRDILGIPNPIIFMAVIMVALWVILNQTALGQHMQAVGGNREAATLSGISVDRTKIAAFMIAGLCAGITGVLLSSRIGNGYVSAGDGYLLASFAAVFLGSAALRDGQFHIVGTFLGVLTVGIGFNGLALAGTPTYFQFLFEGGLLIAAVGLNTVGRRQANL